MGERPTVDVVELSKTFKAPRAKDASRRSRAGVVRAVDAVSFHAEPGRIFGLLGPNGAGKTTTMRILATTVTPSGGTAIGELPHLQQPEQGVNPPGGHLPVHPVKGGEVGYVLARRQPPIQPDIGGQPGGGERHMTFGEPLPQGEAGQRERQSRQEAEGEHQP